MKIAAGTALDVSLHWDGDDIQPIYSAVNRPNA